MLFDTVKRLCEEAGLSIYKLEKEVGLSKGAISKWNNSEPGASKLRDVAKILNTTVDVLLEDAARGAEDRKVKP